MYWQCQSYADVSQAPESRGATERPRRRARAGAGASGPSARHRCIFRTPFNARLASTDGNNALIPVIKSVLEFGLFTCFYFSSMIILNLFCVQLDH